MSHVDDQPLSPALPDGVGDKEYKRIRKLMRASVLGVWRVNHDVVAGIDPWHVVDDAWSSMAEKNFKCKGPLRTTSPGSSPAWLVSFFARCDWTAFSHLMTAANESTRLMTGSVAVAGPAASQPARGSWRSRLPAFTQSAISVCTG
jgi:hypothetical protein